MNLEKDLYAWLRLVEPETMTDDESFRKPGAVPFKWEIRPGMPKIRTDRRYHRHGKHQELQGHGDEEETDNKQSLSPPRKLKPPPSWFQFFPPEEARSQSFRSAPRSRSERWRIDLPKLALARRPIFVSPGCFPTSSLFNRKEKSRAARRPRAQPEPEREPILSPDYLTDLEMPARRPVSTRNSVSPFYDSSSSSYLSCQSSPRLSISSYLSYRSSPQPVRDSDWAGFGLF